MKVLYSPQRNDDVTIRYEINNDIVIATINNKSDYFDFTSLKSGDKIINIKTELKYNPIVKAERKDDDEMYVTLLYFYGKDIDENELDTSWQEV